MDQVSYGKLLLKLLGILVLTVASLGGCVVRREYVSRTTASPLFDARPYEKIAVVVMDQAGQLQQNGDMRQIEDVFLQALLKKGYTLATRSDIESVLSEVKLQMSMFTEYHAVNLGRMLSARAIILVSINSANRTLSISARMLDTNRAQLLWVSSHTGVYSTYLASSSQMSAELISIARAMANDFPNPEIEAPAR